MSSVASQLAAAGLSTAEANNKAALFARMEDVFRPTRDARRWYVPGRIEVLGKHTDYAGGRSLLCATERGMCVMAQPRHDAVVRVTDRKAGEAIQFPLSPDFALPRGWGNYVGTVVRRVARNFPSATRGVDIAISSDLPAAAGLSSSSVLVIATFTALAEMNRLRACDKYKEVLTTPEHLAEYLGCVENGQSYRGLAGDRGVGTFGGSEDHTAILCSQPGHLACYRYCPVTLERQVRLSDEWAFVIGNSGVHASKTGAARDLYNRASRSASAVLEAWRKASGRIDTSLGEVVSRESGATERIREELRDFQHDGFSPEELQVRFEQFLLESEELVPAAVSAVAAGDMHAFRDVVERSQAAAEQLLRNQVPETVALVQSARQLGACAASAFGAGFGGSVWALVNRSQAAGFLQAWRTTYVTAFPSPAATSEFFITGAGPGLLEL